MQWATSQCVLSSEALISAGFGWVDNEDPVAKQRSVAISQTAIRFFSAQSFSAPAVEKIPLRFISSATHVSNFVASVFLLTFEEVTVISTVRPIMLDELRRNRTAYMFVCDNDEKPED